MSHGDQTPETAQSPSAETQSAPRPAEAAEPVGTEAAGVGSATGGPRMVRRVVCGYRLGWLPGDWLQTWRQLDRLFGRAGLNVKATLAPLEHLPPDTDILVVPPALREAAHAAAPPNTPILVTPAAAAAGAFADLVTRLEIGAEFTAEHAEHAEHAEQRMSAR